MKQYQGMILRNTLTKRLKGKSFNISKGIFQQSFDVLKGWNFNEQKLVVNEGLFHVEIPPLAKYAVVVQQVRDEVTTV